MKWHAALFGLMALGLAVLAGGTATGPSTARAASPHLTKQQSKILSGFASFELSQGLGAKEADAKAKPSNYTPSVNDGCRSSGNNVKVNQNCLNVSDPDLQGRGQAQNETTIAEDPSQPNHLVAGYNDYRRGDSTCGASYSLNGGATWNDATLPNGFVRGAAFGGAREYFEASGDPAVAWDSQGNAYYACLQFQRGQPTTNNPDLSSGIYVYRSTGNDGASWHFTGRPVVENSDMSGATLVDKEYIAVDTTDGPFKDRIYVTWTWYLADGSASLYEAYSNDYGEHFSAPVLVNNSSTLCPNGVTGANKCDLTSFSQPFVGGDGALYVVYANYNAGQASPGDNHNQVLLNKSVDGGASFGPPVRVSNFYELPDCATYQGGQDPFVACVPEKAASMDSVFRAANYPSGAVNPANANQVVVTFGSYINRNSNEANGCTPSGLDPSTLQALYTGVKTPGACNNDIVLAASNNGGATFAGAGDPRTAPVVTQDPAQATTDQFWQWAAFTRDGKLAVSYFDRQYGNDETTGYSDISLSSSKDIAAFKTTRVTSSSMPPPTQFTNAQGNGLFYGDYTGLTASSGGASPLWMDTRPDDLFLCPGTATPGTPPQTCTATEADGDSANDQDVYTSKVG
jgi:hypothetical protein